MLSFPNNFKCFEIIPENRKFATKLKCSNSIYESFLSNFSTANQKILISWNSQIVRFRDSNKTFHYPSETWARPICCLPCSRIDWSFYVPLYACSLVNFDVLIISGLWSYCVKSGKIFGKFGILTIRMLFNIIPAKFKHFRMFGIVATR